MEFHKIAWIGTGVMGSQQAGHLAKNGYSVSAYTHKYEKLLELEKEFGIHPCKTIAQAVEDADAIFVMVGYPSDVEGRARHRYDNLFAKPCPETVRNGQRARYPCHGCTGIRR